MAADIRNDVLAKRVRELKEPRKETGEMQILEGAVQGRKKKEEQKEERKEEQRTSENRMEMTAKVSDVQLVQKIECVQLMGKTDRQNRKEKIGRKTLRSALYQCSRSVFSGTGIPTFSHKAALPRKASREPGHTWGSSVPAL